MVLSCALRGLAGRARTGLTPLVGHHVDLSACQVVVAPTRSPVPAALQLLEAHLGLVHVHLFSHAFVLVVEALAVRRVPHELLLEVLYGDLVVRLHDA